VFSHSPTWRRIENSWEANSSPLLSRKLRSRGLLRRVTESSNHFCEVELRRASTRTGEHRSTTDPVLTWRERQQWLRATPKPFVCGYRQDLPRFIQSHQTSCNVDRADITRMPPSRKTAEVIVMLRGGSPHIRKPERTTSTEPTTRRIRSTPVPGQAPANVEYNRRNTHRPKFYLDSHDPLWAGA
jgi:hypothetical protein